jgi:hypothetical protein
MFRSSHLSAMIVALPALAALVAIGCSGDDPVAPEPEPDYFPFSVGSIWTYVSQDTTGALGSDTLFISAVAETFVGTAQAAKLLFEEHRMGPGDPGHPPEPTVTTYYRLVTREGDWVIFYGEDGLPTFRRYRLPFTEGASWNLEDPGSEWHITYVVLAPADVSVPAGDFGSCVPVRTTEYETAYTDSETEYFMAGVGVVMRRERTGSGQVLVAYDIQ